MQWSIHRNVPSSYGIESRRGCGFQTQGLDSVDDNERWNFVEFCLHACFGACKLGCNGVFIETFPLVMGSRAEGGVASRLGGLDSVDDNERWNCVGFCKKNACMHVWGHVNWVLMEYS